MNDAHELERVLREMRMVRNADWRAFYPKVARARLENWIDALARHIQNGEV